MKGSVSRTTLFRIVALVLLLLAAAEMYACDVSDACLTGVPGQNSDCDQPSGDNCLCCCQHVVPVALVTLEAADFVCDGTSPEPAAHAASMTLPIEHPPQL